jgi:hypothetical protein
VATWLNRTLGANGWLYWLMACSLAAPALMFAVLAGAVLQSGWAPIDRTMIIGCMIFIFYIIMLVLLGLVTASSTAKRIELTPAFISLVTFSGRRLSIDRGNCWELRKHNFTKKYHQFLFQKDLEHLVIQDKNHTCYISAYTEDFAGLSEKLEGLQQAN